MHFSSQQLVQSFSSLRHRHAGARGEMLRPIYHPSTRTRGGAEKVRPLRPRLMQRTELDYNLLFYDPAHERGKLPTWGSAGPSAPPPPFACPPVTSNRRGAGRAHPSAFVDLRKGSPPPSALMRTKHAIAASRRTSLLFNGRAQRANAGHHGKM